MNDIFLLKSSSLFEKTFFPLRFPLSTHKTFTSNSRKAEFYNILQVTRFYPLPCSFYNIITQKIVLRHSDLRTSAYLTIITEIQFQGIVQLI